jgi:hypothetical protein
MNAADKIVPWVALREGANPIFVSWNKIDFERELDGKFRKLLSGVLDLGDVFLGIGEVHVPIIEIIADHRIVFAEPDFLEAGFDGMRGVFDRLAHGMPAERRVHVIISRKTHPMNVVETASGVEPVLHRLF